MERFNVIEGGFSFFGREWYRVENYDLNLCSNENQDGEDWLLFEFVSGAKVYMNNHWGGVILFDTDGTIFISYI